MFLSGQYLLRMSNMVLGRAVVTCIERQAKVLVS